MAKKVSLKDIASKVGVSTALVSYVLNGLEKEKRVGKEVVAKIREAARELNYMPNQIARSLRTGSTKTIGLIVADIANPYFGQLARIIEDEAIKYNYTVLFGSSDENAQKSNSLIDTFLNRQIDGFIIAPSEGCEEQISSLIQRNVPTVLIDRYFPEIPSNYVVLNNYQASFNSVQHLVGKGYKRIVMVAYQSTMIHMQERIRGYEEAMIENKLANEIQIKKLDYDQVKEEMDSVVNDLMKNNSADAILFATNALSIAGLYACIKYKISVPEDLAILGFDGNEAFDFFNPTVTYIQQPIEEMGKESVRVLLDQINGKEEDVRIELNHRLIERESCG